MLHVKVALASDEVKELLRLRDGEYFVMKVKPEKREIELELEVLGRSIIL